MALFCPAVRMYPKKIWTFWHDEHVPSLVQVCMRSWSRACPGYDITVVNLATYGQYITKPMPGPLLEMDMQFVADWIRTNLVYEHGGFWIDATIILETDLDTIDQTSDFVGFLVPTDRYFPQIENWFFGAPRHSPLLKAWGDEHDKAIDMGPDAYIAASIIPEKDRYGMPYLWHQLCLSEALAKCKGSTNPDSHCDHQRRVLTFTQTGFRFSKNS